MSRREFQNATSTLIVIASLTWGVGPVFLLPTASDDLLGGEKWGAGPTCLVLKQAGPWTYGVLANHIWSFAGTDSRKDISSTFVQPFLSYTTPTAWTYGVNSESTYDWKGDDLSLPVNFTLGKLVRFGKQPVSFTGGLRYWVDSAKNGPDDVGLRFVVTLLFPK